MERGWTAGEWSSERARLALLRLVEEERWWEEVEEAERDAAVEYLFPKEERR